MSSSKQSHTYNLCQSQLRSDIQGFMAGQIMSDAASYLADKLHQNGVHACTVAVNML
jgi:hypothetical protein